VGLAARTTALLAVLGASLPLFVRERLGRNEWVDDFLAHNKMDLPTRHRLFGWMAAGAILFVSAGVFFVFRRGVTRASDESLGNVRRAALVASPLALLCLIQPLFRIPPWENDAFGLSLTIAVVSLVFEELASQSLHAVPAGFWAWARLKGGALSRRAHTAVRAAPLTLVVLGALGYGLAVSVFTIRYHDRLGTAAFDLGGYDNIFYNALHGHPLRGTIAVPDGGDWSSMRVHAELSVYAFLPLYAIHPSSEALLVIQAFTVGLGAIPVYLLAARRLPRATALLLAGSYLLFSPMAAGNCYDFHFQPLGSTLILWSFYCVDARRWVAFAVFFAVALGCREDVSLSYAIAGVLLVGTGYRPLAGVIVAIVSVAYFGIMRFWVMPHFGGWWFQNMYKDLLPDGDGSLFGVAKTVVSNPLFTLGTLMKQEKFLHVLQIFVPVAFLPLRRRWLWLGFIPAVLGTILTTGYHPTTDTTFQYVFYWIPFVFTGSAIVLAQIKETWGTLRQAAAVAAMTLATVLSSWHWGVILQHKTFNSAWGRINVDPLDDGEKKRLADLKQLASLVPKDASFALTEVEQPHFSTRVDSFALRSGPSNAAYVLYRTGSGDRRGVDEMLASGKYQRIADRGQFVLMERKDLVPKPAEQKKP
jgi:uncharacterized membrane protein